ncbi:hypothetical protein Tco_0568472 [Tanacetum coccineum]
MKDEVGGNLNDEENDFMLGNAYKDDTLEELSATVIMMARIQPMDNKADAEPKYNAEAISEINASQINLINRMLSKGVHEHTNHEKLKTVINTSDDDQIDSNIIFDDPCVENNGAIDEHDSDAHYQSFDIESLIYNVKKEAENQQRMNNDLKKQKALLQKKLETCKERVKTLEKKPVQSLNYKEAYEGLEREISVENDKIERLLKEKDKIQDRSRSILYDDQDTLRDVYKNGVIPMSISLRKYSTEIKQKVTEEVQEMLDIFKSMEKKVEKKSQKDKKLQTEIDRLLEASLTREIKDCVLISVEQQKNEML